MFFQQFRPPNAFWYLFIVAWLKRKKNIGRVFLMVRFWLPGTRAPGPPIWCIFHIPSRATTSSLSMKFSFLSFFSSVLSPRQCFPLVFVVFSIQLLQLANLDGFQLRLSLFVFVLLFAFLFLLRTRGMHGAPCHEGKTSG